MFYVITAAEVRHTPGTGIHLFTETNFLPATITEMDLHFDLNGLSFFSQQSVIYLPLYLPPVSASLPPVNPEAMSAPPAPPTNPNLTAKK